MQKIALIGATGSIGRQTLAVIDRNKDRFCLHSAVSYHGGQEFAALAEKYRPKFCAIVDSESAAKIRPFIDKNIPFYVGQENALHALDGCDIAVIAASGFAGLSYALAAAKMGITIALANKETLVCGGDLFMQKVREKGVSLRPVDSEHSALWQALNFSLDSPFKRLIITASGGPFYGKDRAFLQNVTAADALKHPTWQMGAKITIDSATLLNKAFEVIEAHHLYHAPYEKIHTLVHPESIIHSMVEFDDGAVLAQMGVPSMELPIQLALTYPQRLPCCESINFEKLATLHFLPLGKEKFPCYSLTLDAAKAGGNLPCAVNGAGEVAVHAFLRGEIGFLQIADVLSYALEGTKFAAATEYEILADTDRRARAAANEYIARIQKA